MSAAFFGNEDRVRLILGEARSVAVLGHSDVSRATANKIAQRGPVTRLAAPEDGRTPLLYGNLCLLTPW